MKYKQSRQILEAVKGAQNFILFCHTSPDIDSIISNLIMAEVLESMDKKVDVVSVDPIRDDYQYLGPIEKIQIKDPNGIDFSAYDVLIALDVSELKRFGITDKINFEGTVINIDHHEYSGFGDINLIDNKAGSTSTLLYYMFKDWDMDINSGLLNKILIGIITDTQIFHYSIYNSSFIFRTVGEIIERGGDYDNALFMVDQSKDLMVYKFLAEAIERTRIDKEHRFAYTVIPDRIYKKYKKYGVSSRQICDTYLRGINDTDFCIVIIEREDGLAKVSIRTRTPGFYVIDLVKSLGGGGHLTGGGADVKGENFEIAVEKVMNAARDYAQKYSK